MKHEMKVKEKYFLKIKSGEKIYEVRLNDEKRQQIRIGDEIVFKREPEMKEFLTTKVKDLLYFKSFDELLQIITVKDIGFNNLTKEEVKNIYRQFYTIEDEQKYGVVAIKV